MDIDSQTYFSLTMSNHKVHYTHPVEAVDSIHKYVCGAKLLSTTAQLILWIVSVTYWRHGTAARILKKV